MSIATKLIVALFGLVLVSCLVLGGLGIFFLNRSTNESVESYETAMLDGYKTEIKSQVQSCIAVLQFYYDLQTAGELSEDEAKKAACEAIRSMRYRDDGSGYMWIDATDYTLIMHPILPDQEGDNRYDLTDQNGVKIIQNIITSAQAGGGYNEFYFTKADGVTVAPKLAYSELFEPWEWAVTTGNYTDDMQAEMADQEAVLTGNFRTLLISFIICAIVLLVIAGVFAFVFGHRIGSGIVSVKDELVQIADGNLSFEIDKNLLARHDEVGMIANSVVQLLDNLNYSMSDINEQSAHIMETNDDFSKRFHDITDNVTSVNKAVEEIAQGSTSLATEASSAESQASEIGRVIEENSQSIDKLEKTVELMTELVSESGKVLDELLASNNVTSENIDLVYEKTNLTNVSSSRIREAVTMIQDIAAQTNLLSLNASIEAARAGDAGKSFAVVASEIRTLADDSAQSADRINDIVSELTENSNESVDKMKQVAEDASNQKEKLQLTMESFKSLSDGVKDVAAASKEILGQIEDLRIQKDAISTVVDQLASISEQNAASTEETSASMQSLAQAIDGCKENTQDLNSLSQRLHDDISKFRF